MVWFVCFDITPATAFGIWERKGMSSLASTKDEAIAEVKSTMEKKYGEGLTLIDVFQYSENQED